MGEDIEVEDARLHPHEGAVEGGDDITQMIPIRMNMIEGEEDEDEDPTAMTKMIDVARLEAAVVPHQQEEAEEGHPMVAEEDLIRLMEAEEVLGYRMVEAGEVLVLVLVPIRPMAEAGEALGDPIPHPMAEAARGPTRPKAAAVGLWDTTAHLRQVVGELDPTALRHQVVGVEVHIIPRPARVAMKVEEGLVRTNPHPE